MRNIKCEKCDKEFIRIRQHLSFSKECMIFYLEKYNHKNDFPFNVGKIFYNCVFCGKPVTGGCRAGMCQNCSSSRSYSERASSPQVLKSWILKKSGKNNVMSRPEIREKVIRITKSKEYRDRMRDTLSGERNPRYGVSLLPETKAKIRKSFIRYIEGTCDGKYQPLRGTHEKQLLDLQEQSDNCKIDRNFSVLGYFPDGYCRETNTIYEVYEKFHFKDKRQIKRDKIRQKEIQDELNCCFVVIKDITH